MDGRTFNWSRLLKYVGHDDDQYETPNGDPWSWGWIFRISGVTLRGPITINGAQYYWGFTNLKIRPPIDVCTGTVCGNNDNGDGFPDDPYWNDHTKPVRADGLGAILVQADGSSRGFSNVYLWHAGAWQQVQPDGTFAFIPDVLWQGYDKAKLQWLNNRWEIGVNIGSPSPQCPPNDPCRAVYNPAGGNQIFYIPVAPPVMWNQLPTPDFSTAYELASLIRCMPGTYPNSRSYPFRVENTDLLYSSSNDQYCPANGDFWGMQIVVTRLQ